MKVDARDWEIKALSALEAEELLAGLAGLLVDAVERDGASLGFLPPLELAEAEAYWRGVLEAMRAGAGVT